LEKAKKDADNLIEQARAVSRKPAEPKEEPRPVAETEKSTGLSFQSSFID